MNKTEFNQIIGRNIRYQRGILAITQKELASKLDISYQQMQKYECGGNSISGEKLMKLAVVFGCTLDDLCHEAFDIIKMQLIAEPRNTYGVNTLISHFQRIPTKALRNKACDIVGLIADSQNNQQEAV